MSGNWGLYSPKLTLLPISAMGNALVASTPRDSLRGLMRAVKLDRDNHLPSLKTPWLPGHVIGIRHQDLNLAVGCASMQYIKETTSDG